MHHFQHITICLQGKTEADVKDALNEVIAKIKAGDAVGSDENESSCFVFANHVVDTTPTIDK